MGQAIAKWVTISGIRRTSASDTLEVIVDCYTDLNPAGEDGIAKVVFTTVVNGGAPTVTDVSSRALHYPNHSVQPSPIPGAPSGLMAPVWAYGITLDCNALAAGTIEVTAVVHSGAGTTTPLDGSVILYNDKDGVDRRPNQGVMYVDPVSGNDANNGQLATPKRSLRGAIHGLGGDVGGATIFMLPGSHQLCGPATSPTFPYYTSGHHWLNVVCFPGASFTRQEPYPLFVLSPDPTRNFRIRFIGGLWFGDGLAIDVGSGVEGHAWIDGGGSSATSIYSDAKPWTVLYANVGSSVGPLGGIGNTASMFQYFTCHTRAGVTLGFHDIAHVQDCVISDLQGIYFQSVGENRSEIITNVVCQRGRYATNAVLGYIDVLTSGVATVSVPAAGTMRVTATGTLKQTVSGSPVGEVCTFQGQCAELVGATNWSLLFSGFQTGNNGTFPVTAVGSDWVEVANPSAVSGAAPVGSRIQTATNTGSLYTTVIHTDLIQAFEGRVNCIWANISARDTQGTRGFVTAVFTGATTLNRCALVNCHDGGLTGSNNDLGGILQDCFFAHNSLVNVNMIGTTLTGRTNFVDNVVRAQNSIPTGGNSYIRGNHFITGSTVGLNASSGDWYGENDPEASPWLQTPDSANLGTGTGLLPTASTWTWTGSGGADTRGVYANTGEQDWSVDERGVQIDAVVAAGVKAGVTGTAEVYVQGGVSAGVTLGVTAQALVGSAPPQQVRGMIDVLSRTEVLRRNRRR